MATAPTPEAVVVPDADTTTARARPWRTVVWNDPVNLMSYVTYVFRTYFGFDEPTANRLMLQVHHEGRAIVSSGSREKMEVDVLAMQNYGLWATLEQED